MARKRLADLLREEVNKPAEPEGETTQKDVGGKEVTSEQQAATTQKNTTGRSRQSSPDKQAAPKQSAVVAKAANNGAVATGSTDAAVVSQLHQDLDQSRRREASLTEQLEQLQTELDAQKTLITSLKADLRKHESLAGELKDAKATALQLAEANSKLTQELNDLRQVAKPTPVKVIICTNKLA